MTRRVNTYTVGVSNGKPVIRCVKTGRVLFEIEAEHIDLDFSPNSSITGIAKFRCVEPEGE